MYPTFDWLLVPQASSSWLLDTEVTFEVAHNSVKEEFTILEQGKSSNKISLLQTRQ